MKTLIVEDDFVCRRLLQHILSPYGQCDVAVNGEEALVAFRSAHTEKAPYDLICLDIMMSGMNGHDVLRTVRLDEQAADIAPAEGAKVIMTTALDTRDDILDAFRDGCEAYLRKPIGREILLKKIRELGLITGD